MYCSLSLDNQFIHFQKFSLHFSLSLSLVHFSVIDSSPLLNTSELKISQVPPKDIVFKLYKLDQIFTFFSVVKCLKFVI